MISNGCFPLCYKIKLTNPEQNVLAYKIFSCHYIWQNDIEIAMFCEETLK